MTEPPKRSTFGHCMKEYLLPMANTLAIAGCLIWAAWAFRVRDRDTDRREGLIVNAQARLRQQGEFNSRRIDAVVGELERDHDEEMTLLRAVAARLDVPPPERERYDAPPVRQGEPR